MVKDDRYVAGAWTRRSDDVHGWTVCRERQDAEAAMVKDDGSVNAPCNTDTSAIPGGRMSRAHGRAGATMVRITGMP